MATFPLSAKTHCFVMHLVDIKGKDVEGTVAGKRYRSNVPVERLSTSNIASSGESAAFPLNEWS